MRRMVLMEYCGICWKEDRHEVDAEFSETLNGIDLDLCAAHAEKIPIKLLMVTMREYGTRTMAGTTPPKPKAKAEPTAKAGSTTKAPARDDKLRCTYPGCDLGEDGKAYRAKSPQGLGAHKRSRHGVVGTSDHARRLADKKESVAS